jgi:hypothetical protein
MRNGMRNFQHNRERGGARDGATEGWPEGRGSGRDRVKEHRGGFLGFSIAGGTPALHFAVGHFCQIKFTTNH